ncbi:PepSY domain-containing protein [Xanthobacteraceae bacterium A53D]
MAQATTAAARRPAPPRWRQQVWKKTKHWLYWVHRWFGIAACVLFAMWFASGLVMMYVPYPGQSEAERRAGLPPIAWGEVRLSPAEAEAAVEGPARDMVLQMRGTEPVYRITDATGGLRIISARDGRLIPGMSAEDAVALVRGRADGAAARLIDTRDHDQWMVAQGYNPHRPLHLVSLEDQAGSEAYVSSRTGEVVLVTTRAERFWNWLGSVPHWIYFTPLRKDGLVWANVVLWISGPCIAVALTGMWIGILRIRLRGQRYARGRTSPYKGWMLWHHISGLVGGIAVITFIFSGWMSMNPADYFQRATLPPAATAAFGGSHDRAFPGRPADVAHALPEAVEARFQWFDGRPLILLADAANRTLLVDGQGRRVSLSDADIATAAARLLAAPIAQVERLTAYDAYWYSHHRTRPLPVVRVAFADEAGTWVHVDPETARIAGTSTAQSRVYRWLYNGLHSLDLNILLRNRPAWDVVMWTLSIAGLVISVSGVVIGWRRLRR